MKWVWDTKKIGILMLFFSFTILKPIDQATRNNTFQRLTGSQIATIVLCAGIGITVGVLLDLQHQDEADQPVSNIKKIARRTISGLFGGIVGVIAGVSYCHGTHNTATAQNRQTVPTPPQNNHDNATQIQPQQQPQNPVPAPAAVITPAQQLALKQTKLRTEIRSGQRKDDCPVCIESLSHKESGWAFTCEHLLCIKCINEIRTTSQRPITQNHPFSIEFICPLCRANPTTQIIKL